MAIERSGITCSPSQPLNLWNINEPLEARYRALEMGLKMLRPDIVCLQEAVHDPKSGRGQCELVAEMCGLLQFVEDKGLAILCSTPAIRSNSMALPTFPGDMPRRVLMAEYNIEDRALQVTNVHLAYPPEMVHERRIQAEGLLAAIEHDPSGTIPKLICGDFNDVPDSPAIGAILGSAERFHDVFVECCSGSAGWTYSCRNPYVEPSWNSDERIDYIFASPELAPEDCSVVFDGNGGLDVVSDHFGIFCRLGFR